MPKPRLIAPVPASATTGAFRSSSSTRSIPQDLLLAASRRLGIMSLLGAVLWILGTVLYHLAMRALGPGNPLWMQFTVTDGIAVAASVTSLALFAYSRKGHRSPMFILDLGLFYLVATSIALGLVMHWDPVSHRSEPNPMITWTGVVIVAFSAIVPCAPHKLLVAGLISASMNPLAMLLAKSRGTWNFGPDYYVMVMHYPDFLLVGIAVLISSVVTRLGQQVGKAREMGSYQLVDLLGKGGMGEVWRARHRMLARDAAIKLIQPEMLSDQSSRNASLIQRRFEQEARTTAMLRSPHTVELYDFGVTESGAFYYVMELLDGIDLETLINKFGPQPPARVVGILRQVCRSLSDAHRHGMIHRDIKPTNIFLCRMGNEYDFAKVLDFGLVKVLDNDHVGMTGEGATTGTPAYMAPETALGNPIDARTDIYGLGCVAYWLVTGCYVFEEKGATATMLAHVRKTPVPPSERSEMPVPPSVERAILACLAKEPADRPGSAEALMKMLDGAHDAGAWSAEDAAGWWQTHMPESAVPQPTATDPTL
jgi:eukaryotic-like serine/threonine-protein kinase